MPRKESKKTHESKPLVEANVASGRKGKGEKKRMGW